jgi:aryl-alcohol dehydrogenase-like predicted oxidoreductase
MIAGYATPEATQAYAARAQEPRSYTVTPDGLALASIGLGTARHAASDTIDAAYRQVIGRAFARGCNLIDTAVSYRYQRSERAIGAALQEALQTGVIRRDEVVIASKGGYVPFELEEPADPKAWVNEHYLQPGIAHPNDFVAEYRHCLAPAFLEHSLAQSRANLGLETLDSYFLHNPETQRLTLSRETFRRRMLDAFEMLEQAVSSGLIRAWGLATWTGFRVPPKAPDYLSMAEMVSMAYEVAGADHHLRYVQLPYNAMMPEAFALENQQVNEAYLSPIDAAGELGLTVVASAPIHQGRLTVPIVPQLGEAFPECASDAVRALQFVRSTPGVAAALAGTCDLAHLDENLSLLTLPPAAPETILRLYSR